MQSVKRPRLEDDADKLETLSTNTNDNENTNIAVGPNDLSANPSEGPTRPVLKKFPREAQGDKDRGFVKDWYDYPWVEYSISQNKVFCFACRHFPYKTGEQAFRSIGYENWKHGAKKALKKHDSSGAHKVSIESWAEFKKKQNGASQISTFLDEGHSKLVQQNRTYIRAVIESLIYTCRQDIAQRGHRENENASNRGNFLELLSLIGKFNDTVQSKLQNLPGNAKYTHHSIQNEIIELLASSIRKEICDEVVSAENFAIMVDETKDVSKIEQISFVIRYLYQGEIKEAFLCFTAADGLTAEALHKTMLKTLAFCHIDKNMCVGQCYDGASVMSGCKNGVQKRFRDDVPQAVYIHCFNHRLNLVLVDCIRRVQDAAEFFESMECLYVFFTGSVTHDLFVKKQKELEPKKQVVELKRLCDTRWSCHENACIAVKSTLPAICGTLSDMRTDSSAKRRTEAKSIQSLIDFKFVVTLVIMTTLLHITKTLSDQLQSPTLELASAVDLVNSVISCLQEKRCEKTFADLWEDAQTLWNSLSLNIVSRPTREKQLTQSLKQFVVESTVGIRENMHDAEQFCTGLYYEMIDNMLEELNERFSNNAFAIFEGVSALNPKSPSFLNYDKLINMAEHYGITDKNLKVELHQVQRLLDRKKEKDQIVNSTLEFSTLLEPYRDAFIDLYRLVCIAVTLPVTSASCERSFSALKIIKTYLRSTSGNERTSNIAVLSINEERTKQLNVDTIINAFAANHNNRRIVLL